MPDLSTYYPAVRCIAAIRNRLEFFTRKDEEGNPRMLDGLKFDTGTVTEEKGKDKLPYVQIFDVLSEDAYMVTGGINGSSNLMPGVSEGYTCRLNISVDLTAGFVRADPEDLTKKKGLLEWVALIKDAIETNEEGFEDARLCGSLAKPVKFILVKTDFNQLSMSATLDLELLTHAMQRTKRTVV